MKNQFLTAGEWLVAGGVLFLAGLLVVALFSDGLRSSPERQPEALAPTPIPSPVVGATPVRMIPVATVQPTPRVEGAAGSGVMSLRQAPQVNFKGSVQQMTEQPQSDGQLHVWLNTASGQEQRVSVAPGWFLQFLGCPLQHDIMISGSGFVFKEVNSNLVYAKKIVVNGKACQLRNDEGFALWSNKLR
ncbi:putative Magnetosome protein MamS [Gammaproteobacteria bacterium]